MFRDNKLMISARRSRREFSIFSPKIVWRNRGVNRLSVFSSFTENTTMSFLSPFVRNPLTDFTGPLMSAQTGVRCADFEMKMMNCFEAYGYPKAMELCEAYYDDFKECCTRSKQMSRVQAMQIERERQAKTDNVGYEKPPAMHAL